MCYSWLKKCSVLMLLCTLLSRFDVVLVLMKLLSHYISSLESHIYPSSTHMKLPPSMRMIIYIFQTAKHHSRQAAKIANCFTWIYITVGTYIHVTNSYYSTWERCGVVQQLFSSPCRMLMSFVTELLATVGGQ